MSFRSAFLAALVLASVSTPVGAHAQASCRYGDPRCNLLRQFYRGGYSDPEFFVVQRFPSAPVPFILHSATFSGFVPPSFLCPTVGPLKCDNYEWSVSLSFLLESGENRFFSSRWLTQAEQNITFLFGEKVTLFSWSYTYFRVTDPTHPAFGKDLALGTSLDGRADISIAPEPSTTLLSAGGLIALSAVASRRRGVRRS